MECVFETQALTKRFGTLAALGNIDIQIPRPSILGLLGRNGSGKTTLLRHLMGLYLPTERTATTLGKPAGQLGHDELIRIGFVIVVWVWTALSSRLFATPLTELTVSTLLFLASHDIHRRKLRNYYSTSDLV